MRVLQLGPFPPPHGGVQSNLVAIRTFLRQQGVGCAVINITRHRKTEEDEVYYPSSAAGLTKLVWELKYDVLHLHLGGMLTTRVLALGLMCTLRPGKVSVLTFHSGGFPSTPQGKAIGPNSFAAIVFRRFAGLIGVNQEIMGLFERLRVPPGKTRLIAPHSFLSEEHYTGVMPAALEAFLSAHRPVLISVGLLEHEYDLPLQIDVLGSVRQKFPGAGLLLIGSGNLEPELRKRISECPYSEDILLCGDVPHGITVQAIARADLMLRTTLYDGDAVSVREALHVGTPVIASDNGMRPAGVHLIPRANPKALFEAIAAELTQPVRSKRPYVADDCNVRSVLHFYRELLEAKA